MIRAGLCLLLPVWSAAQVSQTAGPLKLAGPLLVADSPLFTDSAVVRLRFELDGAEIRYTLDGSLPDRQSPRYAGPLVLRRTGWLNAVAFHPDFLPSEALRAFFVKLDTACQPVEATLTTLPDPKYAGQGVTTLLDGIKGGADISDGRWLGYTAEKFDYWFSLREAQNADTLLIGNLVSAGAWIMPPRRVEVQAVRDPEKGYEIVAETILPPVASGDYGEEARWIAIALPPGCRAQHWRVIVENSGPLPDWHAAKGQPAWLFVDEILLLP